MAQAKPGLPVHGGFFREARTREQIDHRDRELLGSQQTGGRIGIAAILAFAGQDQDRGLAAPCRRDAGQEITADRGSSLLHQLQQGQPGQLAPGLVQFLLIVTAQSQHRAASIPEISFQLTLLYGKSSPCVSKKEAVSQFETAPGGFDSGG